MNRRSYIKVLTELGLRPFEARVYLACLELGQATATRISELSEVPRTFCYPILRTLVSQGLASKISVRGAQQFSVISIDKFFALQQEKFHHFEEVLPELRSLQTLTGDAPHVQFLTGMDGIKAAFEDTLEHTPKDGEILIYKTAEGPYYAQEHTHFRNYVKRRVAKKIGVRFIGSNTPRVSLFTKESTTELRQFRLVPAAQFPFANEINIYGNRIAIMSMHGEMMAVIIESESVAATQRSIFELAWAGAGTLA